MDRQREFPKDANAVQRLVKIEALDLQEPNPRNNENYKQNRIDNSQEIIKIRSRENQKVTQQPASSLLGRAQKKLGVLSQTSQAQWRSSGDG